MANKNIIASKAEAVDKLVNEMLASKSYFLCEYKGLTVSQMEELRKTLRKDGCVLKVATNNTLKRAAIKNGFNKLAEFEGPSCIIFSNNESVDGPKVAAEFQKQNKQLVMRDGVVDGQYCTKEEIESISKLPSRMGLLSMLAGGLYQPLQRMSLGLNMIAESKEN